MIDALPSAEIAWLSAFFASPNTLAWSAIAAGTAPSALVEQVRPWLQSLLDEVNEAPIILPFVRGGVITGWYASTRDRRGGYELGLELQAWLGPTYLNIFERVPDDSADPMARVLRARFGAVVYRFAGADSAVNAAIAARIADFGALKQRRPAMLRRTARPVGSIRADFERALLAQDETRAEAMIAELRETGRLNEENLRYLDVRLKAGLGLWPQIARDHWLVATMSDLALPPQILSDIIEALYRTYLDDVEKSGDVASILQAFQQHIAKRYPRLFASRRGIRTPRVVKTFLLLERLQARPDPQIAADLVSLLSEGERATPLIAALAVATEAVSPSTVIDAEEAFDDGQYDRAFELFLGLPLTRKSISRLLSCVLSIGTDEAKQRLIAAIDGADGHIITSLAPAVQQRLEDLRTSPLSTPAVDARLNPWMNWAQLLKRGENLAGAEASIRDGATNWDITPFRHSESLSKGLADLLGNLDGDAAFVLRRSFSQVFTAFFPEGVEPIPATKPIAAVLFLLIAMDDGLSGTDLNLLAQLLTHLLALGLSADDYVSLVGDLKDVQVRVGSYAHLPWSLDVCEALAIAPSPSETARNARLQFFVQVLGQTQAFAHRLQPQDLLPIEFLAKDYGVDDEAVASLKRANKDSATDLVLPDLNGKMIGIYTLAASAGSRAKQVLEAMFPRCTVEVNSDLVCTAKLTNLAKAADLFVFAWKSSSHQAFYCVKDASTKSEPIWALGKGTASILRAICGFRCKAATYSELMAASVPT
jgi:hypothetical protein